MSKYVSLDKRSKKQQKEYHSKQRRTWGNLNPVTRSVSSGKAYNRKKKRKSAKNSEMDLELIFLNCHFNDSICAENILLGDIYTKETEGVLMYIPIENEVFHVHTKRCGHAGNYEDREYVETAIALGATRIVFTDHAPFPGNPLGNRMQYEQLPEYIGAINQLREEYKG